MDILLEVLESPLVIIVVPVAAFLIWFVLAILHALCVRAVYEWRKARGTLPPPRIRVTLTPFAGVRLPPRIRRRY